MSTLLSETFSNAVAETAIRLRARFGARVRDLKIFGSYAWGQPDTDSDIDLCVIIDGLTQPERSEAMLLVAEVAILRDTPISPLVWSTQELESRLSHELALAEDIQAKGVGV